MARRRRLPRGYVRLQFRFPRGVEAYYRSQLVAYVRRMRRELEAPLVKLVQEFAADEAREVQDAAGPPKRKPKSAHRAEQEHRLWHEFYRLAANVERAVPRTVVQRLASQVAKRVVRMVTQTIVDTIQRTVRVDVSSGLTDDVQAQVARATKDNIALITSLPKSYTDNLSKRLSKNFAEGRRWESLAKEIEASGEVTESRAKLIARDQTSKMTAAVNEARQRELGGEEYEWSSSRDELVRDTHRENDGKRFRWDSPPPETGNPGDDPNCRCVAIAIFLLESLLGFPKAAAA